MGEKFFKFTLAVIYCEANKVFPNTQWKNNVDQLMLEDRPDQCSVISGENTCMKPLSHKEEAKYAAKHEGE